MLELWLGLQRGGIGQIHGSLTRELSRPNLLSESAPLHTPALLSATMQATAPSPTVYPEEPAMEQMHCREGVAPQDIGEKLTLTKDWKHPKAHDGIDFVMSLDRFKPAALANIEVEVHIEEMKRSRATAIL